MLKAIGHITLAVLVFFSSTGLVLSKHFCGRELKNIALLVTAGDCHSDQEHETAPPACPMHATSGGTSAAEHPCCQDETEYVKAENEQPKASETQVMPELIPMLVPVLAVLYGLQLPELDEHTLHFQCYKPPLLVCDRPVALQTFLL